MEILELINSGSRRLQSKNIYSHKLDSEILLSEVLNKTREELLISLTVTLTLLSVIFIYCLCKIIIKYCCCSKKKNRALICD